jgi:hypothetical protein
VGDEHRVSAVEGDGGLGEHAWVDHERTIAVVDAHTGVGVLGELHDDHLITAALSTGKMLL